jgi:hypothetical protein
MEEENKILEFGIKRENEERRDGGCAVVFDPKTQMYAMGEDDGDGFYRLFSGGVSVDEDIKEGTLREVVEESGLNDFLYVEKIGEAFAHYYNTLKKVNRAARVTCFLVILNSRRFVGTKLEDHEKFSLIWVTPNEILGNWEKRRDEKNQPEHWIYFLKKSVKKAKELGYDITSFIEE